LKNLSLKSLILEEEYFSWNATNGVVFYTKTTRQALDDGIKYGQIISKEEYLNSYQEKKKRVIKRFDENNT